jgi:hypothetical protein
MDRLGEVVVEGATFAGRACALALARRGLPVTLVADPGQDRESSRPLGYRPWWPLMDPSLYPFAVRGVDLLEALWEESGGGFAMDRHGDLWLARDEPEVEVLRLAAGRAALLGAGPLREHLTPEWYLPSPARGLTGVPGGLDLIEGQAGLRGALPSLSIGAAGGLHVRRAGTVDPVGFGRWLDRAVAAELVTVVADPLVAVEPRGLFHQVTLRSGRELAAVAVVVATDRRATEIARRVTGGGGLREWLRVEAHAVAGRALPPGSPSLHLRAGDGEWIEVRPNDSGIPTLRWTVPAVGAAHLADLVADLEARVEDLLSGIGAGPAGFTTAAAPVFLAPDRRPIVGPIGASYLATAGHGQSIGSALAAAEVLAEYLLEGQFPGYGRAVAVPRSGFEPASGTAAREVFE